MSVERGTKMNKVLIIDDDKDLCILLKKSISIEQIEANYCHSGRDGLVELSKQDYQLVVLDVMMPGMDGFETMEPMANLCCFHPRNLVCFFTVQGIRVRF